MEKIFGIIEKISDIEKAWKKHPIGTTTVRKDGQKYVKISETGNPDKDWELVNKPKGQPGKPESEVDGESEKEVKAPKQATAEELKKHAKETSELALKNAIQSSSDADVRTAAQFELDRREKKEKPQEPEKVESKVKETKTIKKGFEKWL